MFELVRRRLAKIAAIVGLVFVFGTVGFVLIEHVPVLDAFYMTLITVTTIGYGEVFPLSTAGRVFNICLIAFGVTIILLANAGVTQTVVELELNNYFGKRRIRKMIDRLKGHVILCGYGRVGRGAAEGLRASGVDFVVAQGTEGGGHTGTVATIALVPQCVDAVGDKVPVVAAGGLFDGRGLAAALALGAEGVWIGTRFIATPEARAVNGYKDTLLALPEDGTVISRAFTGKTCRVVRNDWTNHFEQHPEELKPFPQQAIDSGKAGANHLGYPTGTEVDVKREFMPCGQGVGAINELAPAGDIVRSMVAEAERTLERIAAVKR